MWHLADIELFGRACPLSGHSGPCLCADQDPARYDWTNRFPPIVDAASRLLLLNVIERDAVQLLGPGGPQLRQALSDRFG